MTDTPSLPAQIEAVREIISSNGTVKFIWPRDVEIWRAVLVTLQQHERLEADLEERKNHLHEVIGFLDAANRRVERLEAVVKAARDLLRYAGIKHPGADNVIVSRERVHTLENALAALGTAAPDKPEDAERDG